MDRQENLHLTYRRRRVDPGEIHRELLRQWWAFECEGMRRSGRLYRLYRQSLQQAREKIAQAGRG